MPFKTKLAITRFDYIIPIAISALDANVNRWVFHNRTGQTLQIIGVSEIHPVAATDASALLDIRNVSTNGSNPSGGVSILSGGLNLKTTANIPVDGSLNATPANLLVPDGSRIGIAPPAALTTFTNALIMLYMKVV